MNNKNAKGRATSRLLGSSLLIIIMLFLGGVLLLPRAIALADDEPAEAAADEPAVSIDTYYQGIDDDAERDYVSRSRHLATGVLRNLEDLPQYPWHHSPLQSIGHIIASYQNYSNDPYFHHGIDSRAPDGTDVFTHSGGQIVNIENYQPGNALYWEVALIDPDGFLWEYHHIDQSSIPQYIWDKFDEYLDDPINGGFVPEGTKLGEIVYWTVVTFGERFHHIHLNMYDANGYINPFAVHAPLPDTQAPEIQAIGIRQNGSNLTGNTVTGPYTLYVRARDLNMHTAFYLPPNYTGFSIDGGPEQVVWEFNNLPGGFDNEAYVSEFFVSPTCGNYSCRDFYIDLGFDPGPDYAFPTDGGEHTIEVTVKDYVGNTDTASFTYTVMAPPGGDALWEDDFETSTGWTVNPSGTDTATLGKWERGNPEQTDSSGPKQLGTTVSGSNDLVTGRLAGSGAGSYDIDGGATTIRSPNISLPASGDITLSFYYYLAHGNNSSSSDYLRVKVVGATTTTMLQELGAADDDDAAWAFHLADISSYAGQTVYLLIEAADASGASLVEAAIDDVAIHAEGELPPNNAPSIVNPGPQADNEGEYVSLYISASDPDAGDTLTFSATGLPAGLSMSPGSGEIWGTLSYNAAAGSPYNVQVTVTDNGAPPLQASTSFSWDIANVNRPPTVTNPGNQANNEGSTIALQVQGGDPDGNGITFAATGLPPGLSMNSSGLISGVIDAGAASGSPYAVEVTVTDDGTPPLNVLAAFSWTVNVPSALDAIYLGSTTSGTVGGVSFQDEDLIAYDMNTGLYSMYFDGSDVGLTVNVGGATKLPDGSLLMTPLSAVTLPAVGSVDDSDIVRFTPTSLGNTTAGTWSMYFDGSDVGLSSDDEDIDAIYLMTDGSIIMSFLGNVSVTGVSGVDEDLLKFTPTSLGATTAGTWSMYFDGSDVGLGTTSYEDIYGVWVDESNGDIYLTTRGAFAVTGVSGTGSDIFICHPITLGNNTSCTFGPGLYWDGSLYGFGNEVADSIFIE